MSRSYGKIVAGYRRQYPHQVVLRNAGDWRGDYCSRAQYRITGDRLVVWYEKADSGTLFVYGFKTAEHAADFKAWTESAGIDWSVEPRQQPLPLPPPPPERPFTYGPSPAGR